MNSAPFNVAVESIHGEIGAFTISGELDQATAGQLREPLHEWIERGTHAVMIGMSGCGFIDSTGLGVIVEAWKMLREHNGERAVLSICCAEPEVQRLLDLTGLDEAIAIRDTRDAAIAAVQP